MWRKTRLSRERNGRRHFLKALLAAGGAAWAGLAMARVGGGSPSGQGEVTPSDSRRESGYRETEHIRRYYQTTRL